MLFFNIGRFLGLNYDEYNDNKKADCLFDNNVVIVDNERLSNIRNEWDDDEEDDDDTMIYNNTCAKRCC